MPGPAGRDGPPGPSAALPRDAVVAFALPDPGEPDADPYPPGWERSAGADGRMLVSVGTHASEATFTVFDAGGARTHRPSVAEMPSHTHDQAARRLVSGVGNTHGLARADDIKRNPPAPSSGGVHTTRPPDLSLYICRRL